MLRITVVRLARIVGALPLHISLFQNEAITNRPILANVYDKQEYQVANQLQEKQSINGRILATSAPGDSRPEIPVVSSRVFVSIVV